MKVLYYYFYLFYTKILPEQEPHATTIFALSMSQSLFLVSIINITMAYLCCKCLKTWQMVGFTLIIMIINYLTYKKKGIALQVVNDKPKFFNSNRISIVLTILYVINLK